MEALKDMVRPIVGNMQWVFEEYTAEEQEVVLYIVSLYCDQQRRRLMRESRGRSPSAGLRASSGQQK